MSKMSSFLDTQSKTHLQYSICWTSVSFQKFIQSSSPTRQRGVPAHILHSFPTESISNENHRLLTNELAKCGICLCSYRSTQVVRKLPCGHEVCRIFILIHVYSSNDYYTHWSNKYMKLDRSSWFITLCRWYANINWKRNKSMIL